MPKLDGMEVMRIIWERSSIPILIISSRDSDVDKAIGLGLGADDYISKPFSLIEISARIKAAIRRATRYSHNDKKAEANIITIHELTILVGGLLSSNSNGFSLGSIIAIPLSFAVVGAIIAYLSIEI